MALKDDIQAEVKRIFRDAWTTSKATVVPEPKDIGLGNDAKEIDSGTVLYADLQESTAMVDTETGKFSAEVYKAYLFTAAKLIRDSGGEITAYDGDRVMAVFLGDTQTSSAAMCALKLNYAVKNIINPAIKAQYAHKTFEVKQVVGIDRSALLVARTGVRGDNDLVWVGRAANYAAKLNALGSYPSYLTDTAYNHLLDWAKYGGEPKRDMWTPLTWTTMNNMRIYGSSWWWEL
jgi:class 3 adenylate cyclase